MKNYQKKVNELLKESPFMLSKLYLAYEINCFFDCECNDDLIDEIYQAFLDHGNYNSIYAFVLAIREWCDINETDFDLVNDYKQMLSEIF